MNGYIPSRKEAIELLKKYTKEFFEIILSHVLAVEKLSLFIAEQIKDDIDLEIISRGALLHDIARALYKLGDINSINHGVKGYEILLKEGIDEKIAMIARNHVGVGITEEDIKKQKLPMKLDNYVPITIEEIIVSYADNRVKGDKIKDVIFPIKRYLKEIGEDYAKRMIDQHNYLVEHGFEIDYNGEETKKLDYSLLDDIKILDYL